MRNVQFSETALKELQLYKSVNTKLVFIIVTFWRKSTNKRSTK